MNVELQKIKRNIYVIGAIIVAAMFGLLWFLSQSFTQIVVTPRNAVITVDGKRVATTNGIANIHTSIGMHMVSILADGYVGFNESLNFGRGLNKKVNIALNESPKPIQISGNAVYLAKGSDFNDGYYLSDKTIYKAKVGLDEDSNVAIIENIPITDPRVTGVSEIIWSPTKDLALFRKENGITLFDFMKYDFVHQTETTWGTTDIGSISWAPDNSKIAYYYAPATGERSLIFANITNTQVERVYNFKELGLDNPILRWSPDSQYLLVIPRNKEQNNNKIYLFNSYSLSIKTIADAGNQIDAVFSPDSNSILYATSVRTATGTASQISVMDKNGENKRDLGFTADLTKIVWGKDSKTIVIAKSEENNQQSIFRFDVSTKQLSGFSVKNLGISPIEALSLSDDGKIILYEAKKQLYAIKVEN